MKQMLLALPVALCLAVPVPVLAEDAATPSGSAAQGEKAPDAKAPDDKTADLSSTLHQLYEMFRQKVPDVADKSGESMQQLADGATPALKDFIQKMGPAMANVLSYIKNLDYYNAPQVLPNGDILIRRKSDAPTYEPPVYGQRPDGKVDL